MTLQWVSADLLTGRVIADLPSFDPDWPLRRTVSTGDQGSGTLHLDGASDALAENWREATRPGAALLACYEDEDDTHPIMWCGYVPARGPRALASNDMPVQLATFEALFDRAFVGDTTYTTAQHRDDILADLITAWWAPATGISYLQLSYTPGNGPTPPLMDSPPASIPNAAIIMQNTDNATVLARMQQVIGQLGGEFTVNWAFSADQQNLVPTLVIGDRVGRATSAGMDPPVTFEAPGSLVDLTLVEDYSDGAGANRVVPYSSGQGESTPFGTPVLAATGGRPTFEYRYQPGANLSPTALNAYAQQAIEILAPGKQPVTLVSTLRRADGRRLGVDWALGDDIGYRIPATYTAVDGAEVTIPAFPDGIEGKGRVIGYELTDTTIAPILADSRIYTEGGA